MYIRPIQQQDLDDLYELAKLSGIGVTSLPDDKAKMQAKLESALSSFNETVAEQQRTYLFALVDPAKEKVAGICALEASIGHNDIWYNYHVGKTVHASHEIGVHKITQTLHLSNDLTSSSEIATLFLTPDYRNNQNGQLLSRSRYLFLAEFSELFSEQIIAEMRGYSDENGRSPFWDSLGKHFFHMEFSDADHLTGLGNKVFIAELMPKFPIYVPMLSDAAQQTIGKVHPQTEPALAMLKSEGFEYNNYVDIFDAGPSVAAKVKNIRAVRESQITAVVIDEQAPEPDLNNKQALLMVSNRQFKDYRVLLASQSALVDGTLMLSPQQATLLQLTESDSARVVSLRPNPSLTPTGA
ncbi:arginine N-succinyltransferase [Reinekea thalattae]|uniref:Arginine N-succinyltransferase n=1 Tax=Reinekea thalattae TaxID=2593301 RepID=A0A5C8YZT2_9GAMM|nr:arginine N-succinyltransferase [Reinekea thalattae]TXR51382.1 arginine N-succinyltransferase [Reinekea thalattae]